LEEFFEILQTPNSLPEGTQAVPDIPPSLAATLAAEAAAAAAGGGGGGGSSDGAAAALSERVHSHGQASSSASSSSVLDNLDQQDLVEAALRLEQQQHPQHRGQAQQHHNLGSADALGGEVAPPVDSRVSISGLGLEVALEDVKFGYQPERQV
jgi:hypothetical protein